MQPPEESRSGSSESASHPTHDLIFEDKKEGKGHSLPIRFIRRSSGSICDLEMKRSNDAEGGSADEKVRSASDKEKTKLRERKRRAITTKIFNGLRKHGGYNLPPRADINDVLRHLAGEAGWLIESDGTTYRSKGPVPHRCPACDYCTVNNPGGPTTATSHFRIGRGGGGDSSTTACPRQTTLIQQPSPSSSDAAAAASGRGFDIAASSSNNRIAVAESDLSLALSMGDEVAAYLLGGTGPQQLTSAYYSEQDGV